MIEICRILLQGDWPIAYDIKYLPYEKGFPLIEAEIKYAVFPEIAETKTAPFAFYTEMMIQAENPTPKLQKSCPAASTRPCCHCGVI